MDTVKSHYLVKFAMLSILVSPTGFYGFADQLEMPLFSKSDKMAEFYGVENGTTGHKR